MEILCLLFHLISYIVYHVFIYILCSSILRYVVDSFSFFIFFFIFFFFSKQKPAYEMRISDWSSDVCSSDLRGKAAADRRQADPSLTAQPFLSAREYTPGGPERTNRRLDHSMPIRHYRALNHEHCRAEIMIPLPSSRLRHYQSSTELTQNDSQVRLRRCASPTFGAVPYCEAPECHLRQRGQAHLREAPEKARFERSCWD